MFCPSAWTASRIANEVTVSVVVKVAMVDLVTVLKDKVSWTGTAEGSRLTSSSHIKVTDLLLSPLVDPLITL